MKARVQRFAWRVWRGEAGLAGRVLGVVLLPAEGIWRLATRIRNRHFRRTGGVRVKGVDVISVGNLAVGGTGKTPIAAWLVDVLMDLGRRPALLLRGYGDDEARLHGIWHPDVPVLAGADRVESARRARAGGADSAVLDDGFQHRRLARGLDVVLLAAEDPVPAPVMPRGPYREPLTALRRADVVIVTRRSAEVAVSRACAEELRAGGFVREATAVAGVRLAVERVVSLEDFVDGSRDPAAELNDEPGEGLGALVLTAIARPDAFARDVQRITGGPVEMHAFADHHEFTLDDIRRVRARTAERPIFVTAKDAVKLMDHADELGEVRVVTQRLAWDWGEEEVREGVRATLHGATRPGP